MKRFCVCLLLSLGFMMPVSVFADDVVLSRGENFLEIMTSEKVIVLQAEETIDGRTGFKSEGWEEFKKELTPQQQADVIYMLMQLENTEAACDEEKSEI